MRFAYKNRGASLLHWDGRTAPSQTRAGETRSLGSLELDIPRPGAPEVVSGYIPEGAARSFGNTLMGEATAPAPVDTSGMIRKVAVLASAYHGVKRNNGSIFWGLAWAAAAYVTPLNGAIVPALGVAQGFGKPK